MLVLTRKLNQAIVIGDDVSITILGLENDRVSIGVDAPRTVRIFRAELLEGTREGNAESLKSAPLSSFKNFKKKK